MLQTRSRRHFLTAAAAASLALAGTASAAPPEGASLIVANYASYVADRGRVNASRPAHQVYADALRENNQLLMGGPLLGVDGRPNGLLLVYVVPSKQQAEVLAQKDPFVQQGAIADYRLAEWSVQDKDLGLLAASLVPEAGRAAADTAEKRLYVGYVQYASKPAGGDGAQAAHQSYMKTLQTSGRLVMAGPFADGSGAMLIYRAGSKEEAAALLQKDPYQAAGAFASSALSEWRLFGLNAALIQGR